MFFRWLKRKPTALDAISFTLRTRDEMQREIRRLEDQRRELQRQINEIGRQVIPDWKG